MTTTTCPRRRTMSFPILSKAELTGRTNSACIRKECILNVDGVEGGHADLL